MGDEIHHRSPGLPNLAKLKAMKANANRRGEEMMAEAKALREANKIEELRALVIRPPQMPSLTWTNKDDSNLPNSRKIRVLRAAADRHGKKMMEAERAVREAEDPKALNAESTARVPSTTPNVLVTPKEPSHQNLRMNTTTPLNTSNSKRQSAKSLPEVIQSVEAPSLRALLLQICTDHPETRNTIASHLSFDTLSLAEQNASQHTPPITLSEAQAAATRPTQKQGMPKANKSTGTPATSIDILSDKGEANTSSKPSRTATISTQAEIADNDGTSHIDSGSGRELNDTLVIFEAAARNTNAAEMTQSYNAGQQVQPLTSTIPNGSSEASEKNNSSRAISFGPELPTPPFSAITTHEREEIISTESEFMEVDNAEHNSSTTALLTTEQNQTEAQVEQITSEIMQVDPLPQPTTIISRTNESNTTSISSNGNITQLVDNESDCDLFVTPTHLARPAKDINAYKSSYAATQMNPNTATVTSIQESTLATSGSFRLHTLTPASSIEITPVYSQGSSVESETNSQKRQHDSPDARAQIIVLTSAEKRKPSRPRKCPPPGREKKRGRPVGRKNKSKVAAVSTPTLKPTPKKAKVARAVIDSDRERNSLPTIYVSDSMITPQIILGDECED